MGITLVVVDHHQVNEELAKLPNAEVVRGASLEEFYKNAHGVLDKDFDLVLSDQDPDGMTSVLVYYLNRLGKRNFQCTRKIFKQEDWDALEAQGVKTVLSLDWFVFQYAELKSLEKIIFIVPQLSGLPNINTSEIVFQSLDTSNMFARDLSTIGTVCDYLVETALPKVTGTIYDYPTVFFDLLPLVHAGGINRHTIWNSKFFDLANMFWSPYVFEQEAGCMKCVDLVLSNPPFSINEVFVTSKNPAVQYLQEKFRQFNALLEKELEHFEKTKQINGKILFYQPAGSDVNFMSRFSSILCDKYGEYVVVMRTRHREDPQKFRYSLRRRDVPVNLGLIVKEIHPTAGGHPEAAGVMYVENPEAFEQSLLQKIDEYVTKN